MSYGRVSYTRGAARASVFANLLRGEAPNLLAVNAETGTSLQLDFQTQTYDIEGSHAQLIGEHYAINYGGNYRRNNFDITLTPDAKDRNEIGGYIQNDVFVGSLRFSIGARLDKFGNLEDPVFSPRLTAVYQPVSGHSLRVGFNRAYRAPSSFNNYVDIALVTPVDLRGLALLLPAELQPVVANPFPLVVHAAGSEVPIGPSVRRPLRQESLTAYEFAYTGVLRRRTTIGAAFYVNDLDNNINFVQLAPTFDPYTPSNPPPGWQLGPGVLAAMAQLGIVLPRTAFTYQNLGPIRQRGLELSLDHRVSPTVSTFANYSWQGDPKVLPDPDPFPAIEVALPPHHRFNVGGTYSGRRLLGALNVNYTDKAFWTEVLTSPYHGFTDAWTQVNGSFGVRWRSGQITTSIKSNNILNRTIQQHVFGDLFRRSVMGEVRFDM